MDLNGSVSVPFVFIWFSINPRADPIFTATTINKTKIKPNNKQILSIFYASLFTASGFALPFSVDVDVDVVDVVNAAVGVVAVCSEHVCSLGFISSPLPPSAGDCSGFDRFNCECSQHLVDVHIFAYLFKIFCSAAITSSYDGGKTL